MLDSLWATRIRAANKMYKEWENLFQVRQLEKIYENRHSSANNVGGRPYHLNMFYSTIQTKLASLLIKNPQFELTAKPGRNIWNPDAAHMLIAQKEAALNTVIQNPRVNFAANIRSAAKDSFFRFGIVESSYAADWRNPAVGPANTNINEDLEADTDKATLRPMLPVPEDERVYSKHIRARSFRVAVEDDPSLNNCAWCGYYSYVRKSTLLTNESIQMPKDFKSNYYAKAEYDESDTTRKKRSTEDIAPEEICRLFNLWDNVSNTKRLLLVDANYDTILEEMFDEIPFSTLCWDEAPPSGENYGFYPMPPAFHWQSPQFEINDVRTQMRRYRQRYTRKYWYTGNEDPMEIQKLSTNEDGVAIKLKKPGPEAFGIVPSTELGTPIQAAFEISMGDFNLVSGTSANSRGVADRTTATESKIISTREQMREDAERMTFDTFVCRVGSKTLTIIEDHFSEGLLVALSGDYTNGFMEAMQLNPKNFVYLSAEQLANKSYNWDINIAVTDAVPARMLEEETKYMKFITIITQNPLVAMSPTLIRETAYRVGYRNEKVIAEFQKVALVNLLGQAQMSQGQGGIAPSQTGPSQATNTNANPQNEIDAQLQNQVGNA